MIYQRSRDATGSQADTYFHLGYSILRRAILIGLGLTIFFSGGLALLLNSRPAHASDHPTESNKQQHLQHLIRSDTDQTIGAASNVTRQKTGANNQLGRFHFLGFGVNNYKGKKIQRLHGAVQDVQRLGKVFAQQSPIDAQAFESRCRAFYDEAVTTENVEQELRDLPQRVEYQGTVVIVFSGHGARHGRDWNFVTYDAEPDRVLQTCLSADTLIYSIDTLIQARDCRVVLIVDTCFGSFAVGAAERLLEKYSDPAHGGLILLLSNVPGEVDRDPNNGGLFASMLVDGLNGLGKLSPSGYVTMQDLRRFFRSESPFNVESNRRLVGLPGIGIPEQICRIESSMSISNDLELTKADPQNAVSLETRIVKDPRFGPGCVTVIDTTESVVGAWYCRNRNESGPLARSSRSEANAALANRSEPVDTQEITLELMHNGDYVVRYRDPLGNPMISAGRYRFQAGSEFSFSGTNGIEYFSLDHLAANQLVLSIPERQFRSGQSNSRTWTFDRIQREAPQ